MSITIAVPRDMLELVADLHLPATEDRRLQALMDRNNDGELSADEKEQLASLAAWSADISLLRSQAMMLLGRRP